MEKTFEFNGKIYREIASLVEAENFRGHVMTCYDGNGVTYETINKITVFDNGSIKLNKRHTNFLLTQCKVGEEPVGIEVGLAGIKWPSISDDLIETAKILGITEYDLKIKMYILNNGYSDEKHPDEHGKHWYIAKHKNMNGFWSWDSHEYGCLMSHYVKSLEVAKMLCKLFNDNNV